MRICVVTDDNAGFTKQEIKDLGIYVIRMPILINGETYFENISVDEKTFYLACIMNKVEMLQDAITDYEVSLMQAKDSEF